MLEKLIEAAKESNAQVYWIAEAEDEGNIRAGRCIPGNLCGNIYSVSKNFTATAIGILVDRKMVSLYDDVWSIFHKDYPSMQEAWKYVTVKHVLTQTTGISSGFLDVDVEDAESYPTGDYLKMVFDRPFEYAPGARFCYSDSNYYLASRIVTAASGKELSEFLRAELFNPLKFTAPAWAKCPYGYAMGATGLYISARDSAKFGLLYANGGVWNGQRIISGEWVTEASSAQVSGRYGYSFWMNGDAPYYECNGMFGQNIFIPRESGKSVIAWSAYDEGNSLAVLRELVEGYYCGG